MLTCWTRGLKVAVSRSILTTSTSLTWAQTLYIPYVGGHTTTLSLPGLHTILKSRSITSSLPTPRKTLSGLGTFLSLHIRSLIGM